MIKMLTKGWLKECKAQSDITVQVLAKESVGKKGHIKLTLSDGQYSDDSSIVPLQLMKQIDGIDINTIIEIRNFRCIFERDRNNSKKRVLVLVEFKQKGVALAVIGKPRVSFAFCRHEKR